MRIHKRVLPAMLFCAVVAMLAEKGLAIIPVMTSGVTDVTMDVTATPGPSDDNYTFNSAGNYYYTEDFTPGNGSADYLAVALNFDGNNLVDEFDDVAAHGPYTIEVFDTDGLALDPPISSAIFTISPTEIPLSDLPSGMEGLPVNFDIQFIPLDGLDHNIMPQQAVSTVSSFVPLPSSALMALAGMGIVGGLLAVQHRGSKRAMGN